MEGEKGTVCVTGGGGYIASWLILRLLQHGYFVRATIRSDPKYKEDVSHLLHLPEAPEKLQIFHAELEKPESFEAAINGCIGVFHLCQPVNFEGNIPTDTIVKTSIDGTLGILQACLKSKTVKKIVYTSSIAATILLHKPEDFKVIDENVWSDVDMLRNLDIPGFSYIPSKTLAENAALEFSKEHGLDVVSIVLSAVIGPFINSSLPTSLPLTIPLIFGNEEQCKNMRTMHLVHIDDVVSAEIFLFESQKAEGRYICSKFDVSLHEMARLLSIKYHEHMIPTDFLSEMKEERPDQISSKKLMDLGFKFKYGLEEMIDGALQCCKDKGLL